MSLLISACASTPAVPGSHTAVNRDSLAQFIRTHRQLTIVYGTQNQQGAEYEALLKPLMSERSWIEFTLTADTAIQDTQLAQEAHLLIGTPASNTWIKQWQEALPLTYQKQAFRFGGKTWNQKQQVLSVSLLPSPAAAGVPLGLFTAATDQGLQDWLRNIPREGWDSPLNNRWGYQVFDGGNRQLIGMFDEDWQPGGTPHWDFTHAPEPDYESDHLRFFQQASTLSVESLRALSLRIEADIRSFQQTWSDATTPFTPIEVHLFPNAERMGLMRSVQQQGHAIPRKDEVLVIANPHYQQLPHHAPLIPFVRQQMGETDHPVLETGMAVAATTNWQKEGWRYWAGRMQAAHTAWKFEEMWDEDSFEEGSPLMTAAMAAAMVTFLEEEWGKDTLRARYADWEAESGDFRAMEPKWRQFLERLAQGTTVKPWQTTPLPYYRGMTLAHEGYRVYNGYGSDSARESVMKLEKLHVNSIAIVPYTGTRATTKPVPYRVWQGSGAENDAAVIGSVLHARELNMQSLLKPQIYFPGAWPGAVKMESEADWQQFFRYYRRWIMHYAMLAAVHEVEAFCVGVEFVHATQTHPDAWRTLIADVRQLYSGPVTYAANWGVEAEKLAFGDALDFIGVNAYYPLSPKENPTEEELRAGFSRIKEKLATLSNRYQKPIVLTELGFRCVSKPWTNPHAETEGRRADPAAQALSYEIVLSEMFQEEWCDGMFWWKWPTYMSYAQDQRTSFTPCHRAAAKVLGEWYEKYAQHKE